ncbi:hypothetical protein [Amycolatopsis sp. NPDC021455]|uniref:hypothetical protein n=1 Tax=Amycolatopsis sp. NPDC021455 TaxID=3154901 RepID=UPI0033C952A5
MRVKRRSWARAVTSVVAAAGLAGGVQVVAAVPAEAAIGPIQVIAGPMSATNSEPTRSASANCPPGTQIISGGGWVFVNGRGADADSVVLSQMQPVHPPSGQDSFVVLGQEMAPGTSSTWWVQAFAVCGQVPGLHVVVGRTQGSQPEQKAVAQCAANERVLGVGGNLVNPVGKVTLTAVTPLTATSAQAVADEDATGLNSNWQLEAYAVCAPTPAGYQIVAKPSSSTANSDPEQVAFVNCLLGTRALGVAAVELSPRPGTGLQVVFPGSPLEVVAVESTPTSLLWGPTLAQGICAT